MEKRNKLITIFKSSDPKELVVFHAASLEDRIRFYLNDTQYFEAIDLGDGNISVEFGEEAKEEQVCRKSKLTIIKENYKEFILLSIVVLILAILIVVLAYFIKNIFVYLIVLHVIYLGINILNVVIFEFNDTSPSLRSKHSAEHMMANFLKIHKRLPRNLEEFKETSRFSTNCGSRKMIDGIAENFIRDILASIIWVVVSSFIFCFYENITAEIAIIIFLGLYYFTIFVLNIFINKRKKMTFIINPMKRVLTYIVQYGNTTLKVKDGDIMLAYCVAREWIQVVYPEFYNKDDDIFEKNKS